MGHGRQFQPDVCTAAGVRRCGNFSALLPVLLPERGVPADLGEGCPEKIDLRFLRFVWNYNRVTLPKMEAQLAGRPGSCRLIELRSRREARQFLEKL